MNNQNHDPSLEEQNVQRLLAEAYEPELPSAEFADQLRASMQAEVQRRRKAATTPTTQPARDAIEWRSLAAAALAVCVIVTTIVFFFGSGDHHDGDDRDPIALADPSVLPASETYVSFQGAMTPRKVDAAPQPKLLAIGKTIRTDSRERRRVALADGSALFLNQNTSAKLLEDRRLRVDSGQVYLEVAPDDSTFLVETPNRKVTALGTRFSVNVSNSSTDVFVVQGKVQLDDLAEPLMAGQRATMQPAGDAQTAPHVSVAPRASHLLDWTESLMAAADSPLVPRSQHAGGALVAVDPDGQKMKLSLRRYHIDVHIEDGFARTTIDQVYFNHLTQRLEGTFHFPLPPDASISRLAMYVGGHLMEGGMVERDYGQHVFESIKYRMLDPALLEWVDGSTFKMRVFPLEGRQEKRIVLSYTQRLDTSYGRTRYRFPAGHSLEKIGHWSLNVRAKNMTPVKWSCDTHRVVAERKGDDLLLKSEATAVLADRDVVIDLNDSQKVAAEAARFSSARHEGFRYLMVRYRPTLKAPSEKSKRPRRDWVILFERSADRNPLVARAQVDALRALLENVEHQDRFIVLTANTQTTALGKLRSASLTNVRAAMRRLEKTHLVGALDLEKAFRAIAEVSTGLKNPVVLHCGSGTPVLGDRDESKLRELLPKRCQYVGIGVGKQWNRNFMKQLASRSGGYFTRINPNEPIAWRAFELLAKLNAPRLVSLEATDPSGRHRWLPFVDSIADGEEFCAAMRIARGKQMPRSVVVEGSLDGKPFNRELKVEDVAAAADYLPRQWARLEIDRLAAADGEKHRESIVALSKAMYVMSPFTSLLVLENEQMYEQYNVDRGRKDHWALYPCPEKIELVHEPLQPEIVKDLPDKSKPNDRQQALETLGTILVDRRWVGGPHVEYDTWSDRYRGWHYQPVLGADEYGVIGYQRQTELGAVRWLDVARFGDAKGAQLNVTDFDELIELIQDTISPDEWHEVGGPGSIAEFETNLSLVISQTQGVHEAIGLRMNVNRLFGNGIETHSWDQRVSPRGAFFVETRTANALRGRMFFDQLWMDDLGDDDWLYFPSRAELPLTVDGFPAEQDLDNVLLEFLRGSDNARSPFRGHSLFGDVYGNVARRRYFDLTGLPPGLRQAAQIRGLERTTPFQIIVDDSSSMRHDALLDSWSLARLEHGVQYGGWYQYPVSDLVLPISLADLAPRAHRRVHHDAGIALQPAGSAELKILQQLDSMTRIQFTQTPLEEVVDYLKEYHGIEIQVDSKALDEIGMGGDTPVTLRVEGITLRSALRLLCKQLDPELTYQIANEVLLITTRIEAEQRLITHSFLVSDLMLRIPQYRLPAVQSREEDSRNLLAYAPGMYATRADVRSVLETELEATKAKPEFGAVDPQAKAWIESARSTGWRSLKIGSENNSPNKSPQIAFDGQGRFRIDRTTPDGLGETVICDGANLWHVYREIGLATRRAVSRFHRQQIAASFPWIVPSADDLARHMHVRVSGERTVELIPVWVEEQPADGKEPVRFVKLQMKFAEDGRLAGRQWILMPDKKVLLTIDFATDGSISWTSGEGEKQKTGRKDFKLTEVAAPELRPEVDELAVVLMPLRTVDHLLAASSLQFANGEITWTRNTGWSEEDATAAIASACLVGDTELATRIMSYWSYDAKREDWQAAFYKFIPLLARSNIRWDDLVRQELKRKLALDWNPLEQHGDAPVNRYLAALANEQRKVKGHGTLPDLKQTTYGLLAAFTEFYGLNRRIEQRMIARDERPSDEALVDDAIRFVKQFRSPRLAWSIASRLPSACNTQEQFGKLAGAFERFADVPALQYATRYERAAHLELAGRKHEAQEAFTSLYQETFDRGFLPPVDRRMMGAFGADDPFGQNDAWRELVRPCADKLTARKAYSSLIRLAVQCRQLERTQLADELVAEAVRAAKSQLSSGKLKKTGAARIRTLLAGLAYYRLSEQADAADAIAGELLADRVAGQVPKLWFIGAQISERRGRLMEAASRHQEALDLALENSGDKVNLKNLRTVYSSLMDRYEQLARALADPQAEPPMHVIADLVRAADRWRSLENDVTEPCRRAASILKTLGAEQLAWDYATSAVAGRGTESATWVSLANWLASNDSPKLAERAFRTAFEVEPTNADILWQQAQMLESSDELDRALKLYQQIAEGDWQPRFSSVKSRAAARMRQSE
jgi:hypothetical protein